MKLEREKKSTQAGKCNMNVYRVDMGTVNERKSSKAKTKRKCYHERRVFLEIERIFVKFARPRPNVTKVGKKKKSST